ncbi:hypothetical protein GRAN_2903 [Granulicella sibirica]|uniref:Uncharacterized protein n=1 Tax=Granulicella sibirica TaxID=2479048 RepID=A0A4Q0T3D8_9BACT|nr:hypothetical protein GRAN_2903 [Granulicella sibirica]
MGGGSGGAAGPFRDDGLMRRQKRGRQLIVIVHDDAET